MFIEYQPCGVILSLDFVLSSSHMVQCLGLQKAHFNGMNVLVAVWIPIYVSVKYLRIWIKSDEMVAV